MGIGLIGIGAFIALATETIGEKKYNSTKDISNQNDKEILARGHLIYLAEKRKQQRSFLTFAGGIASAFYLLGQPIKETERKSTGWVTFENVKTNKNSKMNTYLGLTYATASIYSYIFVSKEEKILNNYLNNNPL